MRRRSSGLLLALVCILGLGLGVRAQVVVQDIRWGFDGKVVRGEFNLLCLTLHNRSEKTFDGPVRLRHGIGFQSRGVAQVARCYLGPGDRRRLQFHPFVGDEAMQFNLTN